MASAASSLQAADPVVPAPALTQAPTTSGKLDFSFIQGGTGADPSAWDAVNSQYIPGRYLLDVVVNDKKPVKQMLDIAPADRDALCLNADWLIRAGIFIDSAYFKETYKQERDCYVLANAPSVSVDMDMASQTLTLGLPQVAQAASLEDVDWNYGNSAMRANYSANVSANDVDTSTFGSLDLKGNVAGWVVTSTMTSTEEDTDVAMATASRPIKALQADVLVGKTFVGDSLLGSAGVIGGALRSNNNMRPNDIGYRPVFSGVARSNARVSLIQAGSTLWSQPVPPGPFAIRDVTLLTSGDVEMVITEQDGSVTRQVFPLTVVSGMIAPGEREFSTSLGVRDDKDNDHGADGGVGSLAYGYGLSNLTLRGSTLVHRDFHGVSASMATSLGDLGGVSLGGAWEQAMYYNGETEQGVKLQATWNKTFSNTGTNVYLNLSRDSEQFTDFASFTPDRDRRCEVKTDFGGFVTGPGGIPLPGQFCLDGIDRQNRNEINLGFSQGFGALTTGLTGWKRDYWNSSSIETGLTGSLSTQVYGATVSLGGSMSQSRNDNGTQNNWSASLSVSVPFSVGERRYSSWTTATTSQQGGAGVTSGISGSVNDRLSYSVGGGRSSDGAAQGTVSGNYTGNRAGLGVSMTQSSSGTIGSVTVTGSVLALPVAKSVIFSRTVSDTVAVANIKDIPGVKLFSGVDATDQAGNVVIPLSGYRYNTVTVDAATLPHDVELGSTSQGVVPVEQSVVYIPFETWKVHRYLLQVRRANGEFVSSGTWARDEQGSPLGFVAQNGVLFMNSITQPGDLRVGDCRVSATKIKETEKVQEVICE
ncbi:outer membrane usher protein FimD/PapC [Pseudomonas fluorescens]|uniref:fimbria/pilus outer membrane usher protein n=1 Tax=Pseudomonas fluorescens TaxID=294 RepID=UPI00209C990D|nr:fimbria/pilus outer membrane usher protein [Pseudomonas fluorescens]MCP1489791.1 outer membrane usher protein FimD/PapC [Pseudomonas fluorescens]